MINKPITMILMMLAGWINREQQHMIDYLKEENSILKSELLKATGKKRIILNDKQRRRLAILAKKLGRRSIKSECLNKMLIFGERHLRYIVSEYISHYHTERPHQGIGNNIITPLPQPKDGKIVCHERLGGLLKSYRRAA